MRILSEVRPLRRRRPKRADVKADIVTLRVPNLVMWAVMGSVIASLVLLNSFLSYMHKKCKSVSELAVFAVRRLSWSKGSANHAGEHVGVQVATQLMWTSERQYAATRNVNVCGRLWELV